MGLIGLNGWDWAFCLLIGVGGQLRRKLIPVPAASMMVKEAGSNMVNCVVRVLDIVA